MAMSASSYLFVDLEHGRELHELGLKQRRLGQEHSHQCGRRSLRLLLLERFALFFGLLYVAFMLIVAAAVFELVRLVLVLVLVVQRLQHRQQLRTRHTLALSLSHSLSH